MSKYCLLCGLALLWLPDARSAEVTLRVGNVPSDEAGREVTRALAGVPGAKVSGAVTKDKPSVRVTFDPSRADLGDLARAAAGARAAGGEPLSAYLVLGYQRFDDSLIEDGEFVPPRVKQALAKLKGKGVDGEGWRIDTKAREVLVRLDGKGGARLADVRAAFPAKEGEVAPVVAFAVK